MAEISEWKAIDEQNVELDGYALSNPYQHVTRKLMGAIKRQFTETSDEISDLKTVVDSGIVYRMSVEKELPLKFPEYAVALAAVGGEATYIWPQGLGYAQDGSLFIKYGGGNKLAIVKYSSDYAYEGWHLVSGGGESLTVVDESGDTYLYLKGSNTTVIRVDVSGWAGDGTELESETVLTASGVGAFLSEDSGTYLLESGGIDYGIVKSRTVYALYDGSFVRRGSVYLPKTAVGWQTSSDSEYYPYVPKSQGVALDGSTIKCVYGASYIPDVAGEESPRCADIGCSVMSLDGSVLAYGVVRADRFIERLQALGFDYVYRTEVEGIGRHPDGLFRTIFIGVRPTYEDAASKGILVLKLMDPDGEDFSSCRSSYSPFSVQRFINGVLPRSDYVYDPITGEKIDTLEKLIAFMSALQIPSTMWYTAAVTIAGVGDLVFPGNALVKVYNMNNSRYFVNVYVSSGVKFYYVSKSDGVYTYVQVGVSTPA